MSVYDEIFLQAMNDNKVINENHEEIQIGKVISESDNGFFVGVGGKSEMILPNSETIGVVKVGDEVEVVLNGTREGIPQVSQKKALAVKAMVQLAKSSEDSTPVRAVVKSVVANKEAKNIGYLVSVDGIEAFLPFSHIRVPKNEHELIGQGFDVVVIKFEPNRIVVSERIIRDQLQKEYFAQFTATHQINDKLLVTVSSISDAFALVTAENITMFLHITMFDWKYIKNLNDVLKVGDQFEVVIKSIDPEKKSIKVSRKDAIENPVDLFFDKQQVGNNIFAKVVRFARGLAILEDENGVEMVLPVGEMSWINRVADPKHLLSIGDRVEVRIKDMNPENGRISTSLRDLLENPWHTAEVNYALNTKHEGKVTSITDFGIFLVFDDGIQGLIRTEDLDWNQTERDLNQQFKKGDTVQATVLNIEPSRERLRLGIKQLSENPYQNFADAHKVGSIVSGTVKQIFNDGAEIDLPNGLVGFIHISQLSTEMVNDVNTVCKVGDEVQAVVRRINVYQQKIELSVKEMVKAEEQKHINQVIDTHTQETPTLGSILGDSLKSK